MLWIITQEFCRMGFQKPETEKHMKQQIENRFKNNYQEFYSKYLQQVKRLGEDEYLGLCPFHPDTHPSFNFNSQTGLYLCRGCNKRGNAIHFYAKLHSLDDRRDFGRILKGIAADFGIEQVKPKIVKVYSYVDEEGRELFQVCRKEPKGFTQRHSNGNGKWIWNLNGVRRVLYNLPLLSSSKEICICEGEKDSNTVMAAGFISTTAPGGAGSWENSYNEFLKGKILTLLPHNDNAGRKHMIKIAQALDGIAESIRWLEIPGLPAGGGDVSNFIEGFENKDEARKRLAKMIAEAQEYKPPKQTTIEDAILDTDQLSNLEIPLRQAIIEPWLLEQSIGLISGDRGIGKTWAGLALLDYISRGENFGPWKTAEPVSSLFLDGEMILRDIKTRLDLLDTKQERKAPLYIYSDSYANHLGLPRANLTSEKWRQKIRAILISRNVKLWVVDNIASLSPGLDENSKRDWDEINQFLLELRFKGISTILLHHTNKSGGQRGTSAREDNIDYSIVLRRPINYEHEHGASFVWSFSKNRTADGTLTNNIHFQLIKDENGNLSWAYASVKTEVRREVLRMIDEGTKQQEIALQLGITKGYVSRIRSDAVKDGHLTANGKLTQIGLMLLNETQENE